MSGDVVFAWSTGALYLMSHFLLYAAVLREQSALQTESGIFLYHLGSIVLFALVVVGASIAAPTYVDFPTLLGLLAAHGIYSISFLEFWSLAQGSYSITILSGVASNKDMSPDAMINAFARVGDAKKSSRLAALSRSSLLKRRDGRVTLTTSGRAVARALAALLWLANIEKAG